MKKRYLILAGMLVMAVAAAGCGKKQGTQETVQTSPTPTPEATKAPEVVNMQTSTEDDITNIMGEKTDTASKVVFVNSTGDDIAAIYVRPHVSDDTDDSDDTWGSDLVNGKFTLKDKDKALYYYNKDQKDSDGSVLLIQMKRRMNASSGIFRCLQFHRSHYVWIHQEMIPFRMRNIFWEVRRKKYQLLMM